jgi:hypothetical protein
MKFWLTKNRRSMLIVSLACSALIIFIAVHALRGGASQAAAFGSSDRGMKELAAMSIRVSERDTRTGPAYEVTISVKGSRTFTMPVLFTQNSRGVVVGVPDASDFSNQWVKARAVGIAQVYGKLAAANQPYLPIDVDHPGTL